jgi:large subunit ribosomal protein L7/L12
MTEVLIAVIVVLVLVIAGLLLARRRRAEPTDLLGAHLAARAEQVDAASAGDQSDLVARVRFLLAQHKKIHAVKAWRDATGATLADAKRAVEQIEVGGRPVQPASKSGAPSLLGPQLMEVARQLKRGGRKIEAIKLVRHHTSLGLREAKEIVDNL